VAQFHASVERVRAAGVQHPVWLLGGGPADRHAGRWAGVCRADGVQGGRRLSAAYRLAPACPGHREGGTARMSETTLDAAALIDQRLAYDGVTIDEEERTRLIEMVPIAQAWMKALSIPELRYAEPALTNPLAPSS